MIKSPGDLLDLIVIGALALAWVSLCLIPPALLVLIIVASARLLS